MEHFHERLEQVSFESAMRDADQIQRNLNIARKDIALIISVDMIQYLSGMEGFSVYESFDPMAFGRKLEFRFGLHRVYVLRGITMSSSFCAAAAIASGNELAQYDGLFVLTDRNELIRVNEVHDNVLGYTKIGNVESKIDTRDLSGDGGNMRAEYIMSTNMSMNQWIDRNMAYNNQTQYVTSWSKPTDSWVPFKYHIIDEPWSQHNGFSYAQKCPRQKDTEFEMSPEFDEFLKQFKKD